MKARAANKPHGPHAKHDEPETNEAPAPTADNPAAAPSPKPAKTPAPAATPGRDDIPGPAYPFGTQMSNRNYFTTFLLATFLGGFGVDRFYTGQIGAGILKLLSTGGFGLWWFIDIVLLLANVRRDNYGRQLWGRDKNFRASLWIFIVICILYAAALCAFFFLVASIINNPEYWRDEFYTAP